MRSLVIGALVLAFGSAVSFAVIDGELIWSIASAQEIVAAPVAGTIQPDGTVDLPKGVPVVVQGRELDFVAKTFQEARAAASEKRWGLFVSILLMAFLAGFNALLIRSQDLRDKLREYMGEIAVGMALLGYIGIAVASLPVGAHITDWWAIIWPAVKTGFAAMGAWEFLAKRVLGFYAPKVWAKLFPPKGLPVMHLDANANAAHCSVCGAISCNPEAVGASCTPPCTGRYVATVEKPLTMDLDTTPTKP